jgi:hypothetical protein
MENYEDYSILEAVQASAADVTFSAGVVTITGLTPFVWGNVDRCRKKSYSAGVASDKSYDLDPGLSKLANTEYSLRVVIPEYSDRTYYTWSGDTAPTAAELVDAFVAKINADENGVVTATDAGDDIQLVMDTVGNGDFRVEVSRSGIIEAVAETVNTAYTAPQGTPALAASETGASGVSDAAQFTRYEIDTKLPMRTDRVNGNEVLRPVTYALYINEVDATDATALIAALDAIIAGTDTAAKYLGKPVS